MDVLDQQWLASTESLRWRPVSMPRAESEWMHPRLRVVIVAALVVVHALALWWWLAYSRALADFVQTTEPLWIEFVTRTPVPIPTETIVIRPPVPRSGRASPHVVRTPRSGLPAQAMTLAMEEPQAMESSPRLYSSDGSLLLPEDLLERIDRKIGDKRDFSFQRPGLDAMEKLLHRPKALEYEATRFEAGWRPEKDRLTELLEKAVEKSSPEIRIPVPGRPGARLVCRVVLLAAGGSCWFESNSDGYQVVLNDPATLNEEEQQQCQAWWDKITAASTQETWRRTRALYEAECRKPPEKRTVEPAAR